MKELSSLFIALFFLSGIFAQTQDLDFTFDELERESKLYVPPSYDEANQYPLVLLLHGLGGNGSNMLNGSGFIEVSNTSEDHFFIVSPTATYQAFLEATEWNEGINPIHDVDDTSYLSALIDSVSAEYSIDPDRIYSTGFSDGGFMTNRLACDLNDRIAAFASVGGTRASSVTCDPDRGTPLLHIHGTADEVVDYTGNTLFGEPLLASLVIGVDDLIFDWTTNNNCVADIAAIQVGENTEAYLYTACDDQSEVWLYKVNGAGHDWNLTSDFSTPELIWEFFSEFNFFVGVEEELERQSIKLYPNPTHGDLQLEGIQKPSDFLIYSALGKKVMSSRFFPGETIDVSGLPEGMYILEISGGDDVQTQTQRFIKN